jgi:hypothetical protein
VIPTVVVLKGTLTMAGSAWAVALCEGDWLFAAVAAPALAICGVQSVRVSRRLRGSRAERSP